MTRAISSMKHHGRNYGFISKVRRLSKFGFIPAAGYLQKSKYRIDAGTIESSLRDVESDGELLLKFAHGSLRRCKAKTRSNFTYNGSFHEAIGPVLVLAQCFCLMPVRGVKSKNIKDLSFKWISFRTAYCLLFIMATIFDTGLTAKMVFNSDVDIRNLEPIIFHISILMATILFLRLALHWPRLMQHWQRVERELPPHGSQKEMKELGIRIKMIVFVAMMVSLMEHLLSTISAIHFANFCPTRDDPIESYFVSVVNQMFVLGEYSPWLAWAGKIENVLLTFGWSYMDIFVMIIGVGLSSLFHQMQRTLVEVKGKDVSSEFWSQRRMQYRKICVLIEDVDDVISMITMLSFANNLYFVCIQLLKSLNKMPSIAHMVYFYFSLCFLLGRTLAVCLYSAEINDRSKEPLDVLKSVPKESWCLEVERFSDEISKDVVALTGMKFFNITRTLILTIAGTIVTYELVLIQFHEDQHKWNCGE